MDTPVDEHKVAASWMVAGKPVFLLIEAAPDWIEFYGMINSVASIENVPGTPSQPQIGSAPDPDNLSNHERLTASVVDIGDLYGRPVGYYTITVTADPTILITGVINAVGHRSHIGLGIHNTAAIDHKFTALRIGGTQIGVHVGSREFVVGTAAAVSLIEVDFVM